MTHSWLYLARAGGSIAPGPGHMATMWTVPEMLERITKRRITVTTVIIVTIEYLVLTLFELAHRTMAPLAGMLQSVLDSVLRGALAWMASVLLQVGPEQAICHMLDAVKAWTSILVIAAAIAIGFALILRGLAPEFSNQFQGAIRSVIVGLIVIAVLPLVATFILTTLGATGTGSGCA